MWKLLIEKSNLQYQGDSNCKKVRDREMEGVKSEQVRKLYQKKTGKEKQWNVGIHVLKVVKWHEKERII